MLSISTGSTYLAQLLLEPTTHWTIIIIILGNWAMASFLTSACSKQYLICHHTDDTLWCMCSTAYHWHCPTIYSLWTNVYLLLAPLIWRYSVTISSQQSRDHRHVAWYLRKETCRRQNYHQQISGAVRADARRQALRHRRQGTVSWPIRCVMTGRTRRISLPSLPPPEADRISRPRVKPSCASPLSSFPSRSCATVRRRQRRLGDIQVDLRRRRRRCGRSS